MPTNQLDKDKTFRYEENKERRVKLVFSQPTRTRPSFFRLKSGTTLSLESSS